MGLRAAAKALVETVIRHDIKTIEPDSIALIAKHQRHTAWFCHDLQLQWFLDTRQVDLVVDVGANEGQFARRLRHTYGGDIISFEPISAPFRRLEEAARNDSRWTVHQFALGSEETTATMHVASDTAFSSLLIPNAFSRQRFRRSASLVDETVHVKRLDRVLEPLLTAASPKRLFLKLDAQGYDLEVFTGLGKYADRVMVMQSEISLVPIYEGMPHWTESVATYEHAGLSVGGMFPVTRDVDGRVIEYDCLLVRAHE